jgi:hypothetical protein
MVLSVVVRMRPLRTDVNGTLVARPATMTLAEHGAVGRNLHRWVRPAHGDHRFVGKRPKGARQR